MPEGKRRKADTKMETKSAKPSMRIEDLVIQQPQDMLENDQRTELRETLAEVARIRREAEADSSNLRLS